MGALEDAEAHLRKSRECLDAAELNLEAKQYNAAASAAVTSGINSKDAICLKLKGRTDKSEDHRTAVTELRAASRQAAGLAPDLQRLLGVKTKAEYHSETVARAEAVKAVERATRLHNGAVEIVSS